jgi:hypothetical protein
MKLARWSTEGVEDSTDVAQLPLQPAGFNVPGRVLYYNREGQTNVCENHFPILLKRKFTC